MRKDLFTVGSYVHVFNRGHRKMPIVREISDKWRFLKMLYYFNDENAIDNWDRELQKYNISLFGRPKHWPNQKPLVIILAYCLMENHYHLLLKEIQKNGISRFMRKLGTGMTNYFNTKYKEVGTLFQGSYKARRVDKDMYLRDLSVYIQVKNPFELYPRGLQKAIEEFEPLSEISEIGSELGFKFSTKDRINIVMTTHDSKIVPKEAKSLLKSGKLTIKELSIGKYNEIYQDYVCSSALRVAREIFGLLPVEEIIVTSKSRILNKTTGKLEDQPILSVRFVRETMNNINFSDIDPSDSMTNFVHNMGFKKSQGMSPVDELNFA